MIESAGSDAPLSLPPSSSFFFPTVSILRDFVFTGGGFAVVVLLKSPCVRGK